MVTLVNKGRPDHTIIKRAPLVVELVGPAGAGKTSLARALNQCNEKILIGTSPYFRRIRDIPFFTRNILLLLPTFLHMYRSNSGRRLTLRELARVVTLNGWHRVLGQASKKYQIVILDQGPIFMLAELHAFGPENLKDQSAQKWWETMYRQWAATLNLVIYLDALDTHLVERIRTRAKSHVVKEKTKPEVFGFLAHYRWAFEHVVSTLTANQNSLRVVCFDTAQESLDGIVNRLLAEFGLKEDVRRSDSHVTSEDD
jgi:thymidylate kinase